MVEQPHRGNHSETILEVARQLPHTLKNFITGLRLSIDDLHELLSEHNLREHADFKISCEELGKGMERLTRLGSSLRELFVLDELETEEVELDGFLRETVLPWFSERYQGYGLAYEAASPPWRVRCSKKGVELCMRHVLTNAVDSGTEPDSIALLLAGENADGREYVRLSVTDRGSGIPEQMRRRLFMPFVSGRAGGVGLGLFITREFMTSFGGRIEVESRQGEGTTVSLLFPQISADT